jgi:hypothetical protein
MNIILVSQNQKSTFCMSVDGCHTFGFHFVKIKFLLASMKSLTKSENPFSNPLQETCSSLPRAACVPKAACDLKTVPKAGHQCTLKKIEQWERKKAGTYVFAACRTFLQLVSVFKEASRNSCFFFSLAKQAKKFKKPSTERTSFIFIGL